MSEEVTRKKIELEIEVGTTTVERGINPYQKWIHIARAIDSWRIFPRVFITTYIVLLYKVVVWYMDLGEPAWFGLYAGTSNASKAFKGESNE